MLEFPPTLARIAFYPITTDEDLICATSLTEPDAMTIIVVLWLSSVKEGLVVNVFCVVLKSEVSGYVGRNISYVHKRYILG